MEIEIDPLNQGGDDEISHFEVPQELPISFNSSDSEDIPLTERFKRIHETKTLEISYSMELRPKVKKKKKRPEDKIITVRKKKTNKNYKCKICKKYMSDAASLKHHLQIHSDERNFDCLYCQFKTKTKKYLARHVRNVHVEEEITKKCKCQVCGKMFKFQSLVDKHMLTHTGEKPEKCDVCGKTFAARYSLKTHMYIHSDEKPFKCSFCDYACRDSSTLRKHHEKHMGIEKYFQCSMCDRRCKSKSNLKVHVAEQHLKLDMKTVHCDKCTRKFRSQKELGWHKRLSHDYDMKAKCEFCGFVVSNKYNLANHMKRHLDLRPYKCTHKKCKKRFKAKSDLQKHARCHDPEDQFTCNLCGRQFRRKNRLNIHLEHHKEKDRYECDYCGFIFCNKMTLGRHIHSSHQSEDRCLYECDGCGYQTKNKPYMAEHFRIAHGTGSSDLHCHICEKTLQTPRNLKDHFWKKHQVKYENAVSFTPDMIVDIIKEEPLDPVEIQDVDPIETNHEETNDLAIEYEGEEVKEDPDDSVENVHRLEVLHSTEGLSEDLVKTVLITNKEKLRKVPEFIFDDVYITATRNHPSKQDEDPLEETDKTIDKYTLERVKKGVKSMLVEVSQLKAVRGLEKSRQLYNERLRLAAKRVKEEKIKVKALNEKKMEVIHEKDIEETDEDDDSSTDNKEIQNTVNQSTRRPVGNGDDKSNESRFELHDTIDIKDFDLKSVLNEDMTDKNSMATNDNDAISNIIKFEDHELATIVKMEEELTGCEYIENKSDRDDEETETIAVTNENDNKGTKIIAITNENDNEDTETIAFTNENNNEGTEIIEITNENDNEDTEKIAVTNENDNKGTEIIAITNENYNKSTEIIAITHENDNEDTVTTAVTNENENKDNKKIAITNENVNKGTEIIAITNENDNEDTETIAITNENDNKGTEIIEITNENYNEDTEKIAITNENYNKSTEIIAITNENDNEDTDTIAVTNENDNKGTKIIAITNENNIQMNLSNLVKNENIKEDGKNIESNNNCKKAKELLLENKINVRHLRQRKAKVTCDIDFESEEANGNKRKNTEASNKMILNFRECFVCFKLFPSKQDLEEHCKQHFDICSDSTLTKCPLCGEVTKSKLSSHLRRKHKIQMNIPYGTITDKQTNESGSRYVYNLNDPDIKEVELIPSIRNLNKREAMKLDREKRLHNDRVVKKTKLVRKGKEWIVDTEELNVKFEDYLLPELGEDEYRCIKVNKKSNYVEDLKNLYQLAKRKGLEMMFPCEHCEKVCQTLSALKLHSRRHDPTAKPFKPKVWKHKLKNKQQIIEKPKKKVNVEHRNAKPKPVKNKHKCDPKLIEFYEKNVRGTNIEFWQFLKIYNRMTKDKIEDFGDVKEFNALGEIQDGLEDEESARLNTCELKGPTPNTVQIFKKSTENKKLLSKKAEVHNIYKRVIRISRKEYSRRQKLMEELRKKINEATR